MIYVRSVKGVYIDNIKSSWWNTLFDLPSFRLWLSICFFLWVIVFQDPSLLDCMMMFLFYRYNYYSAKGQFKWFIWFINYYCNSHGIFYNGLFKKGIPLLIAVVIHWLNSQLISCSLSLWYYWMGVLVTALVRYCSRSIGFWYIFLRYK